MDVKTLVIIFLYLLISLYVTMKSNLDRYPIVKFIFYPSIILGRFIWKIICTIFSLDSIIDWRRDG